jgi:hypothetical protein
MTTYKFDIKGENVMLSGQRAEYWGFLLRFGKKKHPLGFHYSVCFVFYGNI